MGVLNTITVFFVFFSLIIIAFAILIAIKITRAEYDQRVHEYSSRYNQILDLNTSFHFQEVEEDNYLSTVCITKSEFEKFDADKYLLDSLYYGLDFDMVEEIYFRAMYNQKLYQEYVEKISEIIPTSETIIKQNARMKVETFLSIEDAICREEILKPVLNPVLIVKAIYTSPKGRNSYVNKTQYSIDQIGAMMRIANERSANDKTQEYSDIPTSNFIYEKYQRNRRYSNRSSQQRQRSLMTNSLRYDVLKRDHFRCTICGASAKEGAILEVDHIKPVSKGGKTEFNNLRTLCKSCNRGKRDKYDPYGVN